MKNNIPEKGDRIRINPKALEEMRQSSNNSNEDLHTTFEEIEVITIDKVLPSEWNEHNTHHRVVWEVYPTETIPGIGCFVLNGNGAGADADQYYKEPLFILVIDKETNYCSCNGPSIRNWALNKEFFVCKRCKKEKR